jgi:hypothetical protein
MPLTTHISHRPFREQLREAADAARAVTAQVHGNQSCASSKGGSDMTVWRASQLPRCLTILRYPHASALA